MIYYAIRHKASQSIMPLAKRNRGYSHWNPGNGKPEVKIFTSIPRLLESEKQAKKCISMWFSFPNGKQSSYQTYDGEWDDIIDFKPDNRKKEDLEIVEVEVKIGRI